MIVLKDNQLIIRFPNITNNSGVGIEFQRTLRIPDDGRDYHLPPGLGRFPLRHIEDYALEAHEHLKKRGGVMMPMFQADALWLNFSSLGQEHTSLPVAMKIGAGKINAVSGLKWSEGISDDPQNYVVTPTQPWLDGFNVGKGVVRQFVAMPLGDGYSVEEQIDPESEVGGIQIEAIPMKQELYKKMIADHGSSKFLIARNYCVLPTVGLEMGLGMGGSMSQEIYDDDYGLDAWDLGNRQRCFVMLTNAQQWMSITKEEPPLSPISAEQYSEAGLPWFEYFDGDRKAIEGAKSLKQVKSIKSIGDEKGDTAWPDEKSPKEYQVKTISNTQVSDGTW